MKYCNVNIYSDIHHTFKKKVRLAHYASYYCQTL